jgi:hypothetical protein
MFEFRLRLVRAPGGGLELRFHWAQRLLFLGIFGLLASGMAIGNDFSLMGIILAGAALAGALFDDAWSWDPAARVLTHRLGMLGLARRTAWPAAEITGLQLVRFTRGQNLVRASGDRPMHEAPADPAGGQRKPLFATAMIGLAFESREGGLTSIETHRRRRADELETAGRLLSEALQVPLSEIDS